MPGQFITPGFYTVVLGPRHVTIRLKEPDHTFFTNLDEGTLIAAYFSGTANDVKSQYTQFAFVSPEGNAGIWKRYVDKATQVQALRILLAGDMDTAAQSYSLESGRCYRCNRLLTNPKSIEAGIGPVCGHE